MESYHGHLWKRLEYWLKKITLVTRITYLIEPMPQNAGDISYPVKRFCNSKISIEVK